jgi:hypothetical protein
MSTFKEVYMVSDLHDIGKYYVKCDHYIEKEGEVNSLRSELNRIFQRNINVYKHVIIDLFSTTAIIDEGIKVISRFLTTLYEENKNIKVTINGKMKLIKDKEGNNKKICLVPWQQELKSLVKLNKNVKVNI